MKVLNVVYSLQKGGTERVAQNFAVGYSKNGLDSRLLFTRIDGIRNKLLKDKGIQVYSLSEPRDRTNISNWVPDLVHIHSHGVTLEEFNEIYNICPSSKYVETNVWARPSPWAQKLYASYQLSNWCSWNFEKYSRLKYPTALISNAVDTVAFKRVGENQRNEYRKKLGFKQQHIILGRVGQDSESKWSPYLIKIFEDKRQINDLIRLLVVNPPFKILNLINKSRYKEDIKVIDCIFDDSELSSLYSAIDIFVLIADRGESFGMVIAESLLCETPVVTLSTPWGDNSQVEVVGNKVGGLISSSVSELSDDIDYLIKNYDERKRLGQMGRRRVIYEYSLERLSAKSISLVNNRAVFYIPPQKPFDILAQQGVTYDFLSRLILNYERFFWVLRFTTGYEPLRNLPHFIFNNLMKKIFYKKTD